MHPPEYAHGEGRLVPPGTQAVFWIAQAAAQARPLIDLLVGVAATALGSEAHQSVAAAGPQRPLHEAQVLVAAVRGQVVEAAALVTPDTAPPAVAAPDNTPPTVVPADALPDEVPVRAGRRL